MKKKIMKIDEDTYELTEIEIEIPDEKPAEHTKDTSSSIEDTLRGALGCDVDDFYSKYTEWKNAEARFKEVYDPFKEKLIELHETQSFPKNVVIGGVKLTYVSPSTRNSIDSKKLKEEEPEIAKKFTKTSNVGATVRIEEIK